LNFDLGVVLGFACDFEFFSFELVVLTERHVFLTRRHEDRFSSYKFRTEQFTMRLGAQFTARLCRLPKQELKIPKSSAVVPPKTIFAWRTLCLTMLIQALKSYFASQTKWFSR